VRDPRTESSRRTHPVAEGSITAGSKPPERAPIPNEKKRNLETKHDQINFLQALTQVTEESCGHEKCILKVVLKGEHTEAEAFDASLEKKGRSLLEGRFMCSKEACLH